MARKKLNKKVAIIGLAVLAVIGTLIIFVMLATRVPEILGFAPGPDKFIDDGDRALAANDYKQAESDYIKALKRAKTDALKIEIIFKLVDVYLNNQDWKNALTCWEKIIQIKPSEYRARLELLSFFYVYADTGVPGHWQTVASRAKDFLDYIDKSVYSEPLPELKSFDKREKPVASQIGCYVYLLKGRANYEIARRGMTAGLEEMYDQAINDLQTAKELEPDNVNIYRLLSQAITSRGNYLDSKGNLEAKQKAAVEAMQLLEECLTKSKDKVQAEINIVSKKLANADEKGLEAIKLLEPEFLSLSNKYSSVAEVQARTAEYYLLTGPKGIDKVVEYIEKAMALDKENIVYTLAASTMYYYQFAIHDRESFDIFRKAVEMARKATELPDAQDIAGPRSWRNLVNKRTANEILAARYVEQILEQYEPITESEKKDIISKIEDAIHNIEQAFGSGQNLTVTKWNAMLELVTGNRTSAIRKLFSIYEQLTASGRGEEGDPQLSYTLAKEFMNTTEQGAAFLFLSSSLRSGIARWSRPKAVLEFAEVLMKLKLWSQAVANIDIYEQTFGADQKSQTLRIASYIGAGDYEKAEKELEQKPQDNVDTVKMKISIIQARIRGIEGTIAQNRIEQISTNIFSGAGVQSAQEDYLNAQLKTYREALAQQANILLSLDSSSFQDAYTLSVCENYLAEGNVAKAMEFINLVSKKLPDSATTRFYKALLSETQPDKVTTQRRTEIEEQVLKGTSDSLERAISLGLFYKNRNEFAKAREQFMLAIGNYLNEQDTPSEATSDDNIINQKQLAVDQLFSIALQTEDWDLASKIRDAAKSKNIDKCDGKFYAARLAASRNDPAALNLFNEALQIRPVFSYAYLARSNVNAALGKEDAAIDDAKKAALYNPLDGLIAKNLASILYSRNQKLGNSVTPAQKEDLSAALDIAISLNTGDMELLSFYAEFIYNIDSQKALAIRQYMFGLNPTIENAILLGRMATNLASEQTDSVSKERLFKLAEETFSKGKEIAPEDQQLIYNYAQLYNAMGRQQEAEQLIVNSKDKTVLWMHYYENAHYEQARKVLDQLYQSNPKDTRVLKALLAVSEKTANKDDAERYSKELLAIEDNVDNRILQIKVFVNVGLIEVAENKLQSLREKFPDEPRGKYIRAWLSMKMGRLNEALDMANQVIESDENNALAWQLRGQIHLLMSDYERAINDFDRSKLLSSDPQTNILEARAYLGKKVEIYAITELKSVVDDPQVGAEARLLLESIYRKLGRVSDLKQLYQGCLEKYPDNIFWHLRAGRFALSISDFKSAEQLYTDAWKKSVQQGSGSQEALNGFLEVLLLTNQFDRLFEETKKYVDTEYATVAYIQMADAEKRLGNVSLATKYARIAADKAQDNDARFYETLRAMFQIIGKDGIIEYCNDKIRENPNILPAYTALFNVYSMSKEYEKAITMVDKCIELAGSNNLRSTDLTLKKAWTLYLQYLESSDKNFLEKAVDVYESLITDVPNNYSTEVMNNLAYVLAASDERLPDALEYAKKACEKKGNNPEFLDTYAFVLYKNGKYAEADEMIQRAIQLFDARQLDISWEVYERLGMIKEKLGSRIQAYAAYSKALEIGGQEIPENDALRIKAAVERVSGE